MWLKNVISQLHRSFYEFLNFSLVGIHGWLLQDGLNSKANNDFAFDVDPTFVGSSNSSSTPRRVLPSTFAPGLNLTANLFVVTSDGKYIVSGGHWDNSLRIFR